MTDEIRPFRIDIPEGDLADLRDRLARTRWPEAETVDDWTQGIPLAYTRELCEYWADTYDWRATEARLNAHPQFLTEIDGLDIHFLHVRSPNPDALPLVITHGWPGSVVEFDKVIGPAGRPGGPRRIGRRRVPCGLPVAARLRVQRQTVGHRLERGPHRFGLGRADGAASATTGTGPRVATGARPSPPSSVGSDPDHLAGIHLNMPVVSPSSLSFEDLSDTENAAIVSMAHYQQWESGYSKQQSTRPQTVGYGLVDSPAGQCAWIVEKFWAWTDCDGHPEHVLTRDELLDNVMLYWLPGTGASSARLYWESFEKSFTDASGTIDVPTGCSIFPKEIIRISRRWAETRFTDIRYWNELDKGGHFAAFEQPEAYVGELRSFFGLVR